MTKQPKTWHEHCNKESMETKTVELIPLTLTKPWQEIEEQVVWAYDYPLERHTALESARKAWTQYHGGVGIKYTCLDMKGRIA